MTVAALRAFRQKEAGSAPQQPRTRFAVLIPAHNEETVLGRALKSLEAVAYPATMYSVHVVADNCDDGTAAVARSLGADVHERTAPDDPGKGPALNWLLDRVTASGAPYDAVVVLDADSEMSSGFLRIMDARLQEGARAIQSYYAVLEPEQSSAAALRAAALAVRHYLRPLARTAMGGTAGLRGNGMVFAADLLREQTWTSHLTEDLEFEVGLLLHGERVHFAPDAVVMAEMPNRLSDAATQNARWERGRIDVVRRYVPALLRQAVSGNQRRRFAVVDAAVDHLLPPMSILAGATAVNGAAAAVLWLLRPTRRTRVNLVLAAGSALVQAGHLAAGLRMVNAPPAVWLSLSKAPAYATWKSRIWLSALLRGRRIDWVRTPRNTDC